METNRQWALDIEIAEKVMGYKNLNRPVDHLNLVVSSNFRATAWDIGGAVYAEEFLDQFSSTADGAMAVVDKMIAKGYQVNIDYAYNNDTESDNIWCVSFEHPDQENYVFDYGITMFEAICLAALKAVAQESKE